MLTRELIRAAADRISQPRPRSFVFVLAPWMLEYHEDIKRTLTGCRFAASGTEEQRQRWRDVGFDLMEMEQAGEQETGRDQKEG